MDKLLSRRQARDHRREPVHHVFTHTGSGKARVAFAAPVPGHDPADEAGRASAARLICQKDSFLAGARGVSIGIHFQRKILTGLFGGEGFIMQKLEGDGWVFVHAGGTVVERELARRRATRRRHRLRRRLPRHASDFDVRAVGGIKSMLFGGEGVFLATLTGPGKVWMQSLPFSRLAGRMLAAAPQGGGRIAAKVRCWAGWGACWVGITGSRDSGFGIRDSGFGIRDSGFGIRDSGFGIRDSGFGIRDSGKAVIPDAFGNCFSTVPGPPRAGEILAVIPAKAGTEGLGSCAIDHVAGQGNDTGFPPARE